MESDTERCSVCLEPILIQEEPALVAQLLCNKRRKIDQASKDDLQTVMLLVSMFFTWIALSSGLALL
jgi:hypothetical protein